MIRLDKAKAFLEAAGWGDAVLDPMPGDASFRSYARVDKQGQTAILMDAPPPHEDIRPFAALDLYLRDQGLRAPAIFGHDTDGGFLLLEDFGDARFSTALAADPHCEDRLYEMATDILIHLSHIQPERVLTGLHQDYSVPLYNASVLSAEADFLFEWAYPALIGPYTPAQLEDYRTLWRPHFSFLEHRLEQDPCLVLRDYHVDNLMVLEDGHGLDAVGLLDFQDALIGDKAYDLVSLLQDARRDVPVALETRLVGIFIEKAAIEDVAAFKRAYALLGAHRSLRIIGIFLRLWKRDGKPRYLEHLPRLWRYVERNLAHPDLQEIKAWYEAAIPQDVRGKGPEDLL